MKLRILNNSIRLRLSQPEVQRIAAHYPVKVSTDFGNQQTLTYHLSENTSDKIEAIFEENEIHILVPAIRLQDWSTSDEIGIRATIPAGENTTLSVLIEKDFKCLTERPGEVEADLFPHPVDGKKC